MSFPFILAKPSLKVSHDLLLHTIAASVSIYQESPYFIENFLSGRSQRVKTGKNLSGACHVSSGVIR